MKNHLVIYVLLECLLSKMSVLRFILLSIQVTCNKFNMSACSIIHPFAIV